MTTISVTGAFGFIGWHLRTFFHGLPEVETIDLGRREFEDDDCLRSALERCDAVVHCAAVNRAEEEVLLHENPRLAQRLVKACHEVGHRPHVVYTSSIHEEGDSAYGRSKREAGRILEEGFSERGDRYTWLVLPHVFGEHAKPFYNSVVATFCHQLAQGKETEIRRNSDLELVHAQDVAEKILDCVQGELEGRIRINGLRITVRELRDRLVDLLSVYRGGEFPNLNDGFVLALFNTLRSYLFPEWFPVRYHVKSDERGFLYEICKTRSEGQVFLSSTTPEVTRGDHYHRRKVERFAVVRGEALIQTRRLLTREGQRFRVSGDNPAFVDIPTLHAHNITNLGDRPLVTVFFSNDIFDPDNPDTYPEAVE